MVKFSSVFHLALVAFFIFSLGSSLQALDEKKEKKRKEALEEADKKAFEVNMKSYKDHVQSFIKDYCASCHNEKRKKADLNLLTLSPDMKLSTSASRWAVVRDKLETKEMPPEGKDQPELSEVQPVLAWIKAEMKRSRRNFTRRIQVHHANEIPHELLFDPKNDSKLEVQPRLRRLSREIYEKIRQEHGKGFVNLIGNPFTPDPRFLFKDMGAPELDEPTTSQLLRNALTILERHTGYTIENGKVKLKPGAKKDYIKFVDPKEPFGLEEKKKAIQYQFKRVLGRNASDEEEQRFLKLLEKNIEDAGRTLAVRYTLAAVYLLPESIFRSEVGAQLNSEGRARLSANEIADAISYSLLDQRASNELIKSAEKGELDTPEGIREFVFKILENEKLRKPRILRFFREFFEYEKATEVFKNPEEFKGHKARVLVSDTDNLIRWILDRDQDVLKELLTTEKAFVNTRYDSNKKRLTQYEGKSQIHLSYSLPIDWKWTDQQPISLPAGTRRGILNQPSWLVAWSMNDDNHAILRGKWVRERLLGNKVPDLPITVDAQLPHAPEKTLRDRMKVTEEEYCWQCHKLMNPVGLPFESYDHFGRWRAVEKGKPVDATGKIDLVSPTFIAEPIHDAVDFVSKLAKSERVEQVFIRHVFRFFTGRNENLGDGRSLQEAQKAYRESGGSFKSLVASILSSDSFLYRTRG